MLGVSKKSGLQIDPFDRRKYCFSQSFQDRARVFPRILSFAGTTGTQTRSGLFRGFLEIFLEIGSSPKKVGAQFIFKTTKSLMKVIVIQREIYQRSESK